MTYRDDYVHPRAFPIPAYTRMVAEAARTLGIRTEIVDERNGLLVRLHHEDRHVTFETNHFTLNAFNFNQVAKNKVYTYLVLGKAGLRVPRGGYFLRPVHHVSIEWSTGLGRAEAIAYGVSLARRVGYPLVVKPNGLSGGRGVHRVFSDEELRAQVAAVFDDPAYPDDAFIIQEYVPGNEYRLYAIDQELVLAYQRRFPICGDGRSTVAQLVAALNAEAPSADRIDLASPPMAAVLAKESVSPDTVLHDGRVIVLHQATANVHSDGEAVDMTDRVHPSYRTLLAQVARELNLRYFGLDVRCMDIAADAKDATILEVNGNAGLLYFYRHGDLARVLPIWQRLLRIMFDMPVAPAPMHAAVR